MNTPRLSIIVPVYNVEKYLHRCIDSILAQTFTDFELLLVDDGSTDSSGAICDEYTDSRVRVFHKPNGGVSTARNLGIDNAHGEYITFIDSDDWVEPNYGQVLIGNIGDADIMFIDEVWLYEEGCSTIYSSGTFYSHDRSEIEKKILQMVRNDARHNYFGYTWNKIFKRSIIEKYKIRFVEGLSIREDEVFTLDYCFNIASMRVCSPSPIYNYAWKPQGLTHSNRKARTLLANCYVSRLPMFKDKGLISFFESRIINCLIMDSQCAATFKERMQALVGLYRYSGKFEKRHTAIKQYVKLLLKNIYAKQFKR